MTEFSSSGITNKINKLIEKSLASKKPFPHTLLISESRKSNQSLVEHIAQRLNAKLVVANGSDIERPGDIGGLLTNMEDGQILFIDGIHRISRIVEEYLYPAMEEFTIDIMIDRGPSARSVRINLPQFIVVASIPDEGSLSKELKSAFLCTYRFESHSRDELKAIFEKELKKSGIIYDADVLDLLAEKSGKNLTEGMMLLKKAVKYSQMSESAQLNRSVLNECLETMGHMPADGGGSIQNRTVIPDEIKREVWRRDQGKCIKCGNNESLEFDHIIPFSRGGSNMVRNIQLLCEACNRSKSDSI